jgi:Uma2 family endonuclease
MQLLTHKFTTEQFHQMGEAQIFPPSDRLELIEGEVITMSPIGFRHAATINRLLDQFLTLQLQKRTIISIQNSLRLAPHSEPQPDLVLLKPREDFYAHQLPQAKDVLLLIEVADSSLSYDREIKIPLYAKHRINEVWLVNLNQAQLEVYHSPQEGYYQDQTILIAPQTLTPLAFPELEITLTRILN